MGNQIEERISTQVLPPGLLWSSAASKRAWLGGDTHQGTGNPVQGPSQPGSSSDVSRVLAPAEARTQEEGREEGLQVVTLCVGRAGPATEVFFPQGTQKLLPVLNSHMLNRDLATSAVSVSSYSLFQLLFHTSMVDLHMLVSGVQRRFSYIYTHICLLRFFLTGSYHRTLSGIPLRWACSSYR